jgi:hypothetical protein
MSSRSFFEHHWDWTRDLVLDTWPALSDSDLDSVEGDYDSLVTLISDRLGYDWHEAAVRLDEMAAGS